MTQLYKIRPLKWKRNFSDYAQTYESDAADGDYRVTRHRLDCEVHENCQVDSHGEWGEWRWEYCFCEYYDESWTECANPTEGKAAAEAHWQQRMIAGLEAVERPSTLK